jgi:hypothetical protein
VAAGRFLLIFNRGVRMRLPDGSERAVEELKVFVLANPMLVRFDLERASFRDGQLAYGTSQTKCGEFLLSILEVEGNAPGAQVRIRGSWGEAQSYDLTGSHNEEAAVASDEAMRALTGKRP